MKNNQQTKLKRESTENDHRCFEMLRAARTLHQDTVVFDATLQEDGGTKYSIYTCEGETFLQERAQAFLNHPNIHDLVVVMNDGTLVSILTDEENMPAWVETHGTPIPSSGIGVDGYTEEADV